MREIVWFEPMPVIFRENMPDIRTTISLVGAHRQRVARHWAHPAHHHAYYEVNYVLEGSRTAQVGGRAYTQASGDMLLIRPDVVHSNIVDGSDELLHFTMHFTIDDPELMILIDETREVLFHGCSELSAKLERMAEAVGESGTHSLSARLMFQSEAFAFLATLTEQLVQMRKVSHASRADRWELARDLKIRIFQAVHLFVLEDRSAPKRMRIEDICAEFGYCPAYCNRIFKSVYGESLRQYATGLVLDQAKTLLRQMDKPVAEVARSLGYADAAHFSRQFKRWTGQSPFQFRHG